MLTRAIYAGLLACAFLSCQSVHRDCGGTGNPSPFIIQTDITGSIKTGFAAGDRIGIFPVDYVDGIPGIMGDIRNPLNVEYIYDGRYWSAVGNNDIIPEANMTDLYAYYPYDPQISSVTGKTDLGAYPFDLSGDQSVIEADFLWAKTSGVTEGENRALLIFTHVFSRFIINLDYDGSDPGEARLRIHNTWPHVRINLRDGSVTRLDIRDDIIPEKTEVTAKGYDLSYSAMVAPGLITEGTPVFSMDRDDDTSLFYLSSDVELRSGFTYTFNIVVGTMTTEPEIIPDTFTAKIPGNNL